jgi:hypothetical protein
MFQLISMGRLALNFGLVSCNEVKQAKAIKQQVESRFESYNATMGKMVE